MSKIHEQQMCKRKAIAYQRIIEALQRLGEFSLRSFVSIVECSEDYDRQARDTELSLISSRARTEVKQAIDLGYSILPQATLDLLTKYQDESNDYLYHTWLERLEYNHHITGKYIKLLAAAAKQDLQSDA